MRLIQVPSVDGTTYLNPGQITFVEDRPEGAFIMTADGTGIITGEPMDAIVQRLTGEGVTFVTVHKPMMSADQIDRELGARFGD